MLYETEIIKKYLRNGILRLETLNVNTQQRQTMQATMEGIIDLINQLEEDELMEQFKEYMEGRTII